MCGQSTHLPLTSKRECQTVKKKCLKQIGSKDHPKQRKMLFWRNKKRKLKHKSQRSKKKHHKEASNTCIENAISCQDSPDGKTCSVMNSSKFKSKKLVNQNSNSKTVPFQVNSGYYEAVKTPRKEYKGVRNDYGKFGSIVGESMPLEARKDAEKNGLVQSYKKPKRREINENLQSAECKGYQVSSIKSRDVKTNPGYKVDICNSVQKIKKVSNKDNETQPDYYNTMLLEKGNSESVLKKDIYLNPLLENNCNQSYPCEMTDKEELSQSITKYFRNQVAAHSSQISLGVLHQNRARRKQIISNCNNNNSSPYKDKSHISNHSENYPCKIIKIIENIAVTDNEERKTATMCSIERESDNSKDVGDDLSIYGGQDLDQSVEMCPNYKIIKSNDYSLTQMKAVLNMMQKPQSSSGIERK